MWAGNLAPVLAQIIEVGRVSRRNGSGVRSDCNDRPGIFLAILKEIERAIGVCGVNVT
jgi:hypothetical protein